MEKFQNLEIEVIFFYPEDIIVTSNSAIETPEIPIPKNG